MSPIQVHGRQAWSKQLRARLAIVIGFVCVENTQMDTVPLAVRRGTDEMSRLEVCSGALQLMTSKIFCFENSRRKRCPGYRKLRKAKSGTMGAPICWLGQLRFLSPGGCHLLLRPPAKPKPITSVSLHNPVCMTNGGRMTQHYQEKKRKRFSLCNDKDQRTHSTKQRKTGVRA